MRKFKIKRNGNESTQVLMLDELSTYSAVDYAWTSSFMEFVKHSDKHFREIYLKTQADVYNDGMLDAYIDCQVDMEKQAISEQYLAHRSAIKYLKLAQESRSDWLNNKLSDYDVEIHKIETEYPSIVREDKEYICKKRQRSTPFYKKGWCLVAIVGLSSLLDYTTIMSAVDSILTQNVFLSFLLSLCIALLINTTPSIAGIYAKNKHAENRRLILSILGCIFTLLFMLLFGLRWASRDMLFVDTSQLIVPSSASEKAGNTAAEVMMTLVLAIEPALTSAFSFVFAYIGRSETERKTDLAENRLAELYEQKSIWGAQRNEIERILEDSQSEKDEEALYQKQLECLEQLRACLKETARFELAKLIQKPEANGVLLQREPAAIVY